MRGAMLAVGGVLMPLLVAASATQWTPLTNALLMGASLLLAMGGEILGRYLFFVSVVPRQMAAAYLPAAREAA
jgi:DMSO reductase anchor subunit